MGNKVDPKLYDFLKEHETGLYKEHDGRVRVVGFVHIPFYSLNEFVEIVGKYPFEEGGQQVTMFENSICVELNDIIGGDGNSLSDYKNCFEEHDWKNYRNEINQQEGQ